jgi:hypothetical protein
LPVLEPQAADLPLLSVLLQTAHGGGQAKGQANTAGRSASLQHLVLAVNQWKNIGKACHGLCPYMVHDSGMSKNITIMPSSQHFQMLKPCCRKMTLFLAKS